MVQTMAIRLTTPAPAALAVPFPWGYAFHLAIAGFGVALIGPMYTSYVPVFLKELGLNATLIGFLSSLDSYGSLLILPTVAALSDRTRTRLGRRAPFMLAAAPVVAVAFAALPHGRSLPLLLPAIFGTVLGMAVLRGPTASLLGDRFPPVWRDRASGVTNLTGGLAWVLAFVLGGALYLQDRTLPFLVLGITMLLCVAFVALTLRKPAPGVERVAPATPPAGTGDGAALADPHVWRVLRGILSGGNPRLLAILLALLTWIAGTFAVANFFTLYGQQVLHIKPGFATQLLGLYAIAGVLFAVPAGLLTRRFGRRRMLAAGFAGLFGLFILAYFANDVWTIGALLALAGVAGTAGSVNTLPMVLEAAPPGDVGTYTGLTYIFGAVGGLLGPLLAGQLIDFTGSYRSIFLFGPLMMALALILILRVPDSAPAAE